MTPRRRENRRGISAESRTSARLKRTCDRRSTVSRTIVMESRFYPLVRLVSRSFRSHAMGHRRGHRRVKARSLATDRISVQRTPLSTLVGMAKGARYSRLRPVREARTVSYRLRLREKALSGEVTTPLRAQLQPRDSNCDSVPRVAHAGGICINGKYPRDAGHESNVPADPEYV